MNQGVEVKKSGPHINFKEDNFIQYINNTSIIVQTKNKIMNEQLQTPYGVQQCSWDLNAGSEVTLLQQLYFEQYLLPKIKLVTGEKAKAQHYLDSQLPRWATTN